MRSIILCFFVLFSCAPNAADQLRLVDVDEQRAGLRAHIVPGMTFGNVALQQQTVSVAFDVVAKAAMQEGCSGTQMSVSDTWPLSQPKDSEYSDAFLKWTELWTYEVCGQHTTVAVVYMLHKKTGEINLSVSPVEEGKTIEFS